jgi:hypothetical protein
MGSERLDAREISLGVASICLHIVVISEKIAERRRLSKVDHGGNRPCVERSKTYAVSFGLADPQMPG